MSALQIQGLTARHGLLTAVRDLTLDIAAGEKVALVGANGAGKTTLLRTIAGVHPAFSGQVLLDGVDITATPAHKRAAAGIALVPEGRRLFADMSVAENLMVSRSARRSGPWNLDTVVEAFPQLKPKLKARAGELSGGQQQATAIGRALMLNPTILLLDEVSLGLSPLAVEGVYASLQALLAMRVTIVLVEQDLKRTFAVADRIVCMLEGGIVAEGRADQMSREQVMEYYFGNRAPSAKVGA